MAANNKDRALMAGARAYSVHCAEKVKQLELRWRRGELKSWADVGIEDIPPLDLAKPFNYQNLKSFLAPWQASAEARYKFREINRSVEAGKVSTRFVAASETAGITHVGKFKLRPRQKKCIDLMIERFNTKPSRALVCPLEGGEGKSVIGHGMIKYWQDNQYFGHNTPKILKYNCAMFVTAPPVVIDMKARGYACDVKGIGAEVCVMGHSEWHTKTWDPFFRQVTVETHGVKVTREQYIMPPPAIIVLDEFDAYKKRESKKSQRMLAVIEAGIKAGSVFIFMSATPWVTVNNTWLFCIATGLKWNGEPITIETFPSMAHAIAARAGAKPDDNSPRAMEEFRKEFNDCYIIPPRDPRKVKARNSVRLLEFKNDADRGFYQRTMERYQEELERIGQGDTQINKLTAFLKFRQSEEWLKCPYFVDLMLESHAKGFAPVCGISFTASCNEIVRQLVARGIPRNKISVIQGGDEIITKDKLIKMVGEDFFKKAPQYILRYQDPEKFGPLTPTERTAVRKYLKWVKERFRNEESESEQATRIEELRRLRLYKQSKQERHDEKEKFQNGQTEFMVFTLSSGGRGIDMDHQFEHVRPREGFFTICYWAEEFLQALYRLMRTATLTNVDQHMCFFAGTEVANHVAPRLDKKLKAVRAGVMGSDDLAYEAIDLLAKAQPITNITAKDLRDGSDTDDEEGFDADGVLEQEQQELQLEED